MRGSRGVGEWEGDVYRCQGWDEGGDEFVLYVLPDMTPKGEKQKPF
jgi:hypothetical protein